jgi:hypothetical protein
MFSLAALFLAIPPIKLKLELHINGGVLIANYLDQSIVVIGQSKILRRNQVQFSTLFLGGAQLCCAFYQPRQAARIWCEKTNFVS